MRARRWAALAAGVLSAAVIGGCSASGESAADPPAPHQQDDAGQKTSPAAPPEGEALDDPAICTAFSDVLTILENADLGLASGRMEAQEHAGWYQLATRVLDRLPSTGGSDVQSAIGELQEIAPAVPAGAGAEPVGVRSPEWMDAQAALSASCDDLAVPLTIGMFTGG